VYPATGIHGIGDWDSVDFDLAAVSTRHLSDTVAEVADAGCRRVAGVEAEAVSVDLAGRGVVKYPY